MKLLILGGTAFVGRHLAQAALDRGHAVALFNRGQRNPGLFPEAEHLIGDRDGNLRALEHGRWDAVIDTSGYVPRVVRASAELLRDRVERYVFISTISVYAEARPGMDETAPLMTLADPTSEAGGPGAYGGLKALCERAVQEIYGGRSLIIRPGIIAGPHDPTDRFTYWAKAIAGPGPVLAPAPATAPVQVIDARDLAAWTLRMLERGMGGVYNAVGPAEPVTRRSFLEALRTRPSGPAIGWLEPEHLEAEGLESHQCFPFWTAPEDAAFFAMSNARALHAGLALRPLAETARDTLAWLETEPPRPLKYGLEPARASRLLERLAAEGRLEPYPRS